MKRVLAVVSVVFLVSMAAPAYAHNEPEGDGTGGAFSPKFDESPVTIMLCLTEDACPIKK